MHVSQIENLDTQLHAKATTLPVIIFIWVVIYIWLAINTIPAIIDGLKWGALQILHDVAFIIGGHHIWVCG